MWKQISRFVQSVLFPVPCVRCGAPPNWLCENCKRKLINQIKRSAECPICRLKRTNGFVCATCKRKKSYADFHLQRLIYGFTYNENIKKIIHELKFQKHWALSSLCASLLKAVWFQHTPRGMSDKGNAFIFIPSPTSAKRVRHRGFDHTKLLCKKLTSNLKERNTIFMFNLLIKTRHTTKQSKLNKSERKKNLRNSIGIDARSLYLMYRHHQKKQTDKTESKHTLQNNIAKLLKISKEYSKNYVFVIVDDVATTGSTLNECAKTLKILKPKEIWGLTLARGENKKSAS